MTVALSVQKDPGRRHRVDAAQVDPSFLGIVATHQHFMIGSVQETMAKPARERKLHLLDVPRRKRERPAGPGVVDGPSVVAGDVGHVLGSLEPAFDLQPRYAQLDQPGNQIIGCKVLRTEKVLRSSQVDRGTVADDLVGHAAGLTYA